MSDEPSGTDVSNSDIRPLVRAQLSELRTQVERAESRIQHRLTKAHLMDVITRIDAILKGDGG